MLKSLFATFIFVLLFIFNVSGQFLRPLDRGVSRLAQLKELKNCLEEIPGIFANFCFSHFNQTFP